jgi:LacI family transcriptional regulator
LHQRIADGAVIAASVPYLREDTLAGLARSGLPLVVMSNAATPAGCDIVRAPESEACGAALDHLFRSGRRRIAFVGHTYDVEGNAPTERRTAYLDALERHGVRATDSIIVAGADSRVAGYRAVAELLDGPDPPDAIFAASDRAAISAIRAAVDAGRTVPDDVAVVGVGNLEEGLVTRPTLSTVGPAAQEYGEVTQLLFERVLSEERLPGRVRVTPWSFIHRESA